MAKKLDWYERQTRVSEQRRLAEYKFQLRQREREQKMRERDSERATIRREKDYEKQKKELQKKFAELVKLNQIQALNKEVANFDKYLSDIVNFHKNFQLIDFDERFTKRLEKRTYNKNTFYKTELPKENIAEFKRNDFKPVDFENSSYKILKTGWFAYPAIFGTLIFFVSFSIAFSFLIGLAAGIANFVIFLIIGLIIEKNAKNKFENELIPFEKNLFEKEQEERFNNYNLLLNDTQTNFIKKFKKEFDVKDEERKKQFEKQEQKYEDFFDSNEKGRLLVLNYLKNGDLSAYNHLLEAILPLEIETNISDDYVSAKISEYEVGYYVDDDKKIKLSIILPDFSIIPETGIKMTATGKKMSEYSLSEKVRRDLYNDFIISFTYLHAMEVFKNIPFAEEIFIECSLYGNSEVTGENTQTNLIQVKINKSTFSKIDFRKIELLPSLENFEYIFNKYGLKPKKEIQSNLDENKLIWATEEDEGYIIPFGLIEGQENLVLQNEFSTSTIISKFPNEIESEIQNLSKIATVEEYIRNIGTRITKTKAKYKNGVRAFLIILLYLAIGLGINFLSN